MKIELYPGLEPGDIARAKESLPALIWEFSVDYSLLELKLIYISKYVKKLLKYSVEEFLSSDDFFLKIMHTDDRIFVLEKMRDLLKRKKDDIIEFRWIAKNGSIVWVESHFVLLYNSEGIPVGIKVISLDITKGKLVEQEINARIRQHAAISSLGTRALEGIATTDLMNEAVLVIKDVLQCEYVKVLELLPKENLFILRAAAGWQKELINNAKVGAGNNSEAGYALLTCEPVIIDDLRAERRFKKQALLFDHNVVSGMSIVIKGHTGPYGVLSVHTTRKRCFNEDDSNFLNSIANIIAAAVERNRTESELAVSLKEKEILLKEIHHRVKNNLQVISSLLNLQSRYITDPVILEVFNESQNRIKSMALIHEKLYQSKNFYKINFEDYVNDLLKNLFESYFYGHSRVKRTVIINDIYLSIDSAVAVGLIINELISNALKHAFINLREGLPGDEEIVVKMESHNNKYTLSIKDNGRGFPGNIDFKDTSTLGLQLVNTLVEQIGGTIEMARNNGTEITITF